MLLLTRGRAVEDMAEVVVVTEDGNDPVVEDKQEDAMPGQRTLLNFAGLSCRQQRLPRTQLCGRMAAASASQTAREN